MIKLELIGNLGANARSQTMNDGKTVVNFSIAVNNGKDGNGNQRPATWVSASLWYEKGKEAKLLPYLLEGAKVYVSGYPKAEAYQDKTGVAVAGLNLFVNQIELLGAKKQDDNQQESLTNQTEDKLPY